MIRLNLGMMRASSLPAAVGICAADISAVAAIVNEAQERLLNDPLAPDEGWWGGWAKMIFNVQVSNRSAYITTPRDIARLIAVNVCQSPIKLRNGFYEFLEFGTGEVPKNCGTCATGLATTCNSVLEAYERDTVALLTAQTISPCNLRIYAADNADLGTRVLIQGTDQNGRVITTTDTTTQFPINGEYVTLAAPFVDTLNQFATVTGIVRGSGQGLVQVFQVDPVTADEVLLTALENNETTGWYRRYFLNGLPPGCCNQPCGTVQVTAQAKLDFHPANADADWLIIQSRMALLEEAQAIRYSRMDSAQAPGLETKHHAKALQLLFGQLDHYLGKTKTAISVPIFGTDRPRLQPH